GKAIINRTNEVIQLLLHLTRMVLDQAANMYLPPQSRVRMLLPHQDPGRWLLLRYRLRMLEVIDLEKACVSLLLA
ncbi:MAG: hypothetical protein ACREO5_11300, partial [Candidatus Binatia bacterium]